MTVRFKGGGATTIVEGGAINPTDSFSIKIAFPDTNATPLDNVAVAFTFPETIGTPSDTATVRITFPDSIVVPSDNLVSLQITHSDTNSVPSDNVSLSVTFLDTVATQSDTVTLRLTFPETNVAPVDEFGSLQIAHSESNAVLIDASTFNINFLASDSGATPTDTHRLSINGLGDSNAAPTDTQRGTSTWAQGATTSASTGTNAWTNPANAQGLVDTTLAIATDPSAIANFSGILTLSPYPNPDTTFSSWTISQVLVREYARYLPGLVPGEGSWVLEYRLDGTSAYTILESLNVTFDSRTTPKNFDITTAIGGVWANVNGFNARCRFICGVVEQGSAEVDAVVLEVIAIKNPI